MTWVHVCIWVHVYGCMWSILAGLVKMAENWLRQPGHSAKLTILANMAKSGQLWLIWLNLAKFGKIG